MDKLDKVLNKIIISTTIVGGYISHVLGGWDLALKILIGFMVTDYIVGVLASYINGETNSKVGFRGICKKVLLLVPIGIAFSLDLLMDVDVLRNMAVIFYISNEGISIIENLAKADILIPEKIKEKLVQLQKEEEVK